MSADPLDFLNSSTSSAPSTDPLEFLGNARSSLEKKARLAAQYGIGTLERLTMPYDIAVAPLASKGAQMGELRKNTFEDIERLTEQKQTGQWNPQDEQLLQHLVSQIRNPEEMQKHVKTADISAGGLIEKGSKALGYDISPEGLEEHAARFTGNILSPKNIAKAGKGIIELAPKLATKEGREALKLSSKWKSLTKAAKGDTAKQEILDFAKSKNLTPEETTLLFQSDAKIKTLEKISKKSKRFKDVVSGLKEKLGASYTELKNVGRQGGYLNQGDITALKEDLNVIKNDIGKTFVEGPDTEEAAKLIDKAIFNLDNKAGTVEELINSRRNLRQFKNWKQLHEGDAIRAKAEKAILDAIERKNPMVARELQKTDKAWGKYKQFEKIMEKHANAPKFLGMPVTGLMGHFIFGGLGLMKAGIPGVLESVALKEAVQRISTRMLTDPKFQSIRKKMMQSITSGAVKNQKGIFTAFLKVLEKEDPDLFDEFNQALSGSK